jgi:hypothetical protein
MEWLETMMDEPLTYLRQVVTLARLTGNADDQTLWFLVAKVAEKFNVSPLDLLDLAIEKGAAS